MSFGKGLITTSYQEKRHFQIERICGRHIDYNLESFYVTESEEYILRKGENPDYQHLLLFRQCLQRVVLARNYAVTSCAVGLGDPGISKCSLTNRIRAIFSETIYRRCPLFLDYYLSLCIIYEAFERPGWLPKTRESITFGINLWETN